MQTLSSLKHQAVRDLAWSCFGPNIVEHFPGADKGLNGAVQSCPITLTNRRQQWLLQLDQNPTLLLNHLARLKSTRLGLYFEALWQFFIQQDEQLELIAHNLRVYREKVTLGEFDILYRDLATDEIFHLELAIKYYLNCSTTVLNRDQHFSTAYKYWVGPNTIDRLDKKLAHLLNHQIELSELQESTGVLEKCGIKNTEGKSINKVIALKGMLFYPHSVAADRRFEANVANERLSNNHLHGEWIHLEEFIERCDAYTYWCHLQKPRWISPPTYNCVEDLISAENLAEYMGDYFSRTTRPAMICAMREDSGSMQEVRRYFVTANSWPSK